ncbi:GNAT family N-acetyltransferase [Francisellaceae bacterium]|nr:GNAT family N-acetyltransferase [Francisellaceae bacterium]
MLEFYWKRFEELSVIDMFDMLRARQDIFIIEQNCIYPDIDDLDKKSWHLLARENNELVAYLRVVFPGYKYDELSIGRVLTVEKYRGQGVGYKLVAEAINNIKQIDVDAKIRISAQFHLQKFYGSFGFKAASEPYDEDGIPHIEMCR